MQYEEYYFGLKSLEAPSRWDPGVVYDPLRGGDVKILQSRAERNRQRRQQPAPWQ